MLVKPTTLLFETLWAELSVGWSIASRAYARAMRLAGIDVRLHSWAAITEEPDAAVLAEVEGMLRPCEQGWDFYLFSTPLASPEIMAQPLLILRDYGRPRCFYTMFERASVQPEIVTLLNELEGVLVPCSRNEESLKKSGCHRATWVPFPYFDTDPHLALAHPDTSRRFYWIGDWQPRKAPDNLIRAFLRAFKPGEAELEMKLTEDWKKPFSSPEDVIAAELDRSEVRNAGWDSTSAALAIQLTRGRLSQKEMLAIHARNDVYVSASRGEGLDLPAYAAKLAGRRVVTTDSGGPRDFLGEDDILVKATGEIVATDYQDFWGAGARYADYELDDLIAAMQLARSGINWSEERLPQNFRAENVGKRLCDWVEVSSGRA